MVKELRDELEEAYHDEVTSAFNYLSLSKRLEGFFGEELSDELSADFGEEIGHAKELARLLDEVFDVAVPYASSLKLERQPFLETINDYTADEDDLVEVLEAVSNAERGAIERYTKIAELADTHGYPDVRLFAEELLAEERSHLDETESLLAQFE
jgi:rubrerythrin